MEKTVPEWSLIRPFLAVAEHGSLSGAARALGSSQPTVGRQIKALEEELGTTLFHRRAKGLDPTDTALEFLPAAKRMRDAMQEIVLAAAGEDHSPGGTVRVTASQFLSHHALPPVIAAIRRDEPDIEIELVPSDESRNLLFREADIALRMYRPTQLDLVTRHIGDIALAVFVSRRYVAARGMPTVDTMLQHDWVGYDTNPAIVDGFKALGFDIERTFFRTRTDDQVTYWELVRAGCGIGFGQGRIGQKDPDLIEVPLGVPLPVLPIWLTAHEAMRQTRRIRRVWDLLADGLSPLVS